MMLGGHAALAMVMGRDEEMTIPMMEPVTITVCEDCGTKSTSVVIMAEDWSARRGRLKNNE